MATRFAVKTGLWSDATAWDNGEVPVAGDTVYPNGFTVTIDTDISVASLNNNISNVYLPSMPIPAMTGNTQPSGTANASSNTTVAFQAFDQNKSTQWLPTTNATGWISYDFGSNKLIKRYFILGGNNYVTKWRFDGWDSATSQWVTLEDKTAVNINTSLGYLSPLLSHTTQYSMYRIDILTSSNSGFPPQLLTFEMTESTSTSYGTGTGGSFTVPSSLSGTRNIVQTGAGIISNNSSTVGVVNTSHIAGNTVNFNIASGGYIINPFWIIGGVDVNNIKGIIINGTGTVNFNGNIWGHTGATYNGATGASIYINANATITINGNVYAPIGNATSDSYTIQSAVSTSISAILNINGDIIGSGASIRSYTIFCNTAITINITGNITSNKGNCLQSNFANIINIIGNINLTDINSTYAIYLTGTGSLITMNGSITNKNNLMAIFAPKIRFVSTSTPYWIFQTNAGTNMTLAYGSAIGEFPNEADVKLGVSYAADPIRIGTCAVPLPQYVSQGVATGSTIGTAYLNAADVWNILTSTITVSGSIGERLKNASTVQTTGDQIASYQV